MPKGRFYLRLPPRRKREGKTDYRLRVKLVKSGLPRLVVRRTNRYIYVQLIMSVKGGDKTILGVTSKRLAQYGWRASMKNTSAAYLTGLLAGRLALAKGYNKAIADIGRLRAIPGSRVFAAIKGAIDGGLNVNMSEEVAPSEERIKGEHIVRFYEQISSREGRTQLTKISAEVLQRLPEHFEEVKSRILS